MASLQESLCRTIHIPKAWRNAVAVSELAARSTAAPLQRTYTYKTTKLERKLQFQKKDCFLHSIAQAGYSVFVAEPQVHPSLPRVGATAAWLRPPCAADYAAVSTAAASSLCRASRSCTTHAASTMRSALTTALCRLPAALRLPTSRATAGRRAMVAVKSSERCPTIPVRTAQAALSRTARSYLCGVDDAGHPADETP